MLALKSNFQKYTAQIAADQAWEAQLTFKPGVERHAVTFTIQATLWKAPCGCCGWGSGTSADLEDVTVSGDTRGVWMSRCLSSKSPQWTKRLCDAIIF